MSQPTDIIIGCPYRDRGWIIKQWYEHAIDAVERSDLSEVSFVFAASEDDPDIEYLESIGTVLSTDEQFKPYDRSWNETKYGFMAQLRNQLLDHVRVEKPKFYLSLDSDILVNKSFIREAVKLTDIYDGVGGVCYLDQTDRNIVNIANLNPSGSGFERVRNPLPHGKCSALMAIKMMKPELYNSVEYEYHRLGEDLGWSRNVREEGFLLGYVNIKSKHVMSEHYLNMEDSRVGY